MTITNSSTRLVAIAAAVAVALALMGAAAVAPAQAAGLTPTQISSIVSLLASFGADTATINNVTAALNGQATTGTGTSGGSSAACPALSRSLQLGSTGADVMALQKFLNGNASTQVSASGAGSPGLESTYFGPATKAAVTKFQTLNSVSAIGIVGPATRAAIAAVCGTGNPGPGTGTGTGTTGGSVTVSAGAQPVNSLAPKGSSRVPFTTFTLSNNSSAAVTINSVTVQRAGLAQDAAFSGVVLLDSNGLQVGTAKTFNSNHQANVGDVGWTLPAGSSQTFTVAGNMASSLSAYTGQVAAITVVAVNTGATVSGSLPITGASQTLNDSLTVGTVSTTTSSFDPGSTQTRNIGDVAIRFAGIKFTAGSTEDLKLYSVRWRQVGSGSSVDLANVVTNASGTAYPTTVDTSGKYYTTIFPGGLLITKGNSIDVYIQGDIVGSNASNRTIDFDIDKVTDVYFVGQLYGYGVAPSGTYTPWYNGYAVTVQGGTVTTISKANSGKAAAQNIAINVNNQPMGGFTTNFAGESTTITGLTATVATSSATTGLLTSVSIVDENGAVVAGPVDATWVAGVQTLTFTDTLTFSTGAHTYYFQGKVPSTANNGAGIAITTIPSSGWSNPTGQSTGNSVSLSSAGSITMNTVTVKGAALTVSLSTTPSSQNIISGSAGFTFSSLLLDASQSGEDVRMASLPIIETGFSSNLTGCQLYDGTTALNTSSRVINTVNGGVKTTVSFDNVLRIPKGTTKTIAVKCNLSSAATSSSSYVFSNDTNTADWSVTGDVSGVNVTPILTTSTGGTLTVQTASLSFTVDATSPASSTVASESAGQIVSVFNVKGSNDAVSLTKIAVNMVVGSSTVTALHFFNGSTLLGDLTMGSGVSVGTTTLATPLALTADTNYKITVKADFAAIGIGKPGSNGGVVQVNPSSIEGFGTSGTVVAAGSGSTPGVRVFNTYPVFTYDTTGATAISGINTLLTLNVTGAGPAGENVGLYKLSFQFATTTATLSSPTFTGPTGAVASTTLGLDYIGANSTGSNPTLHVIFDSSTNRNDATVGTGETKQYLLKGTVALTGSTNTTGSVATALIADTSAVAVGATSTMATSLNIWSPMATSTSMSLDGTSPMDFVNLYANRAGCFATAGLAVNCEQRVVSR